LSASAALAFFIAGLIGSVPFGLIVTKCLGTVDPRRAGSGNIGATNVLRTSGWGPGLLTLAGDVFKGALAVSAAPVLAAGGSAPEPALQVTAALGAVLGHIFSPFSNFRGGKGVATGLGIFALLMPGPAAWAALVFLGALLGTRYVSVGSILGAATVPLAAFLSGYSQEATATAALIAALIIWRHTDNIRRLLRGKEHRLGQKENG